MSLQEEWAVGRRSHRENSFLVSEIDIGLPAMHELCPSVHTALAFNFAVDNGEECLQTYSLGFEIVSNEKH